MRIALQPDQYQPAYPTGSESPSIWSHMSASLHDTVIRVLSLFINILPGLLAFILALALMAAFGVLLSFLLRKALAAAKFDERIATGDSSGVSSIADWSPNHSPTALAGRIAFWSCVLLGLIIGILALDASYASGTVLSVSLLPYLTRSVGAVLLLFAGNLIARFLARTVLIGSVNNQLQYARFLSYGVNWLVLVLTAAMVLDHLQVGGTVVELAFGILFGGIVLTLALAIGLGSRDLVSRSLERSTSEKPINIPTVQTTHETETLRHF